MISKSEKAQDAWELQELVIDAIQDIKGQDIVLLDMRKLRDANADYFIICHGNSNTQVMGIASNVQKRVWQEFGERAASMEGQGARQWVVLDYFSVVVHVFTKDRRPFYNLEALWSDAKQTKYENLH